MDICTACGMREASVRVGTWPVCNQCAMRAVRTAGRIVTGAVSAYPRIKNVVGATSPSDTAKNLATGAFLIAAVLGVGYLYARFPAHLYKDE